jgi:hypothetical protein
MDRFLKTRMDASVSAPPSVIIGYETLAQVSAYRRGSADTNQTESDSGSMSGYPLF